MIVISNKQRDDILRYIELMCANMTQTDNRTYNAKRLAIRLYRILKAKPTISKKDVLAAVKSFLC